METMTRLRSISPALIVSLLINVGLLFGAGRMLAGVDNESAVRFEVELEQPLVKPVAVKPVKIAALPKEPLPEKTPERPKEMPVPKKQSKEPPAVRAREEMRKSAPIVSAGRPAALDGGTRNTGPGAATGVGDSGGTLGEGGTGGWKTGVHEEGGTGTGGSDNTSLPAPEQPKPPPAPKPQTPPSPKPEPAHEPPKPKGETRSARVAKSSQPEYPSAVRQEGIEGTSILRVRLDDRGEVTGVEIIESAGDRRLDKAAEKEVRKWDFEPRLENGVASASTIRVRIKFDLDR